MCNECCPAHGVYYHNINHLPQFISAIILMIQLNFSLQASKVIIQGQNSDGIIFSLRGTITVRCVLHHRSDTLPSSSN